MTFRSAIPGKDSKAFPLLFRVRRRSGEEKVRAEAQGAEGLVLYRKEFGCGVHAGDVDEVERLLVCVGLLGGSADVGEWCDLLQV